MRKLLNEHKWKAIISSLIILIPMVIGFLLWSKLPNSMTIHWGADGNADSMGPKLFVVVGLPLILLALHWVGLLITCADPGNKNQTRTGIGLIFWIVPICSLLIHGALFSSALGHEFSLMLVPAGMGIVLVVLGNYLPKVKRNYTLGIKVPWAVRDKENWNATHRFGGKVWMIGGLVLLLSLFLPEKAVFPVILAVTLVLVVIPILYSYLYYKMHLKMDTYTGWDTPVSPPRKSSPRAALSSPFWSLFWWACFCSRAILNTG